MKHRKGASSRGCFLGVVEVRWSTLDESQWVHVEDNCITSGSVPFNPEDQYCVRPNGEVYLKCGGPTSEGVGASCSLFEGHGSDADQASAIGGTIVTFQRTPVTTPAAS